MENLQDQVKYVQDTLQKVLPDIYIEFRSVYVGRSTCDLQFKAMGLFTQCRIVEVGGYDKNIKIQLNQLVREIYDNFCAELFKLRMNDK